MNVNFSFFFPYFLFIRAPVVFILMGIMAKVEVFLGQ